VTETIVGRRELNKVRTREAIVSALRALVQERPVDEVTVDQIAEAAGISRRTFFNYFPGIPALLSEVIGSHTEHLPEALGTLSGDTTPIERVRELVRTIGIPVDLLDWLAVLNLHATDESASDSLLALERSVWADKGAWLERELVRRLPEDTDELYVATLASTIMSCFAAAEQTWIARRDALAPVDDAAVAAFHAELDRALSYASAGWAAPSASPPAP
jgi:AcrR family transcriptional regulator